MTKETSIQCKEYFLHKIGDINVYVKQEKADAVGKGRDKPNATLVFQGKTSDNNGIRKYGWTRGHLV